MRVSNELMRLVLSRMHKIQCVVCITRLLRVASMRYRKISLSQHSRSGIRMHTLESISSACPYLVGTYAYMLLLASMHTV